VRRRPSRRRLYQANSRDNVGLPINLIQLAIEPTGTQRAALDEVTH
jgi:hypothetical protein